MRFKPGSVMAVAWDTGSKSEAHSPDFISKMVTLSVLLSHSAKGRPEEPSSVWWDSHVVYQGARKSHCEAWGELQPELAAILSAHQVAGFHAWGTKTEHMIPKPVPASRYWPSAVPKSLNNGLLSVTNQINHFKVQRDLRETCFSDTKQKSTDLIVLPKVQQNWSETICGGFAQLLNVDN